MSETVFIHPSAIVDEGAVLGAGTKVWHFSHVMAGAQIGQRCVLGQNVFIAGKARVGNGVKVQNNVSIYDGVEIDDDVFCGPSTVFTNVVNPRAFVERKHEFMVTRVCRGATIGANATVLCGLTLGEYCFIGAGAVVTANVPPYAMILGVPGRISGWVSQHGEFLYFGSTDTAVCHATGQKYCRVAEDRVELLQT